jgi:nicotinamidase-related amidase
MKVPAKNHDLHGSAPDSSPAALILIDVINDLEFEGGEKLVRPALRAARRIAALVEQARKRHVPVIYANDNFGRWRSDFHQVVAHCLQEGIRGRPITELLRPEPDDYFVLKPKHSAFFSTTLDTLLEYLKAERLVLTGFSGDQCVMLTAADAYMRDFELYTPRDCTASTSPVENRRALQYMARVFDVDTALSTRLDLARLARRARDTTRRRKTAGPRARK